MFADRIKQLLSESGNKQLDLALFIGVKQNTVSDWINRGTSPKIEHIYRIVDFFGVSFDYLFNGDSQASPSFNSSKFIELSSTSQKIDFKNKILNFKDDSFFTRFKEARKAAGVSLEEAAAGAFLSVDALRLLEDDDIPIMEIDVRMEKVREIGWEQISYLAYKYDVDLYWLLCGKVRPPAAVVQNGQLVYPPYEFMMESSQQPKTDQPKPNKPSKFESVLTIPERFDKMVRAVKERIPSDDDFDNLYPTDPEYDMQIPWVAAGGSHLDPEKYEAMQKGLRLLEKKSRLTQEARDQKNRENEGK